MTQEPWWNEHTSDPDHSQPQASGTPGHPSFGEPSSTQFNTSQNAPHNPSTAYPHDVAAWQHGSEATPPHQATWAPAPKTGLIPLRPLTAGDVLSASFRLLRTNLSVNLGSSLIVMLILTLVIGGISTLLFVNGLNRMEMSSGQDLEEISAGNATLLIVLQIAGGLLGLLAGSFLQGALAHSIARAAIGDKTSFGETWSMAFKRFPAVLGSILIQSAVFFVAMLVAMVPIIITFVALGGDLSQRENSALVAIVAIVSMLLYFAVILVAQALYVRLGFSPIIAVLERANGIHSIKRSWQLTRGYFWRTFGIQLLVSMILQTVMSFAIGGIYAIVLIPVIIFMPLGAGGEADMTVVTVVMSIVLIVVMLLVTIISALMTVVQYGANVFLYLDLRFRKEGFNLKLQKTTDDIAQGIAVDDPFAADAESLRLGALKPVKTPAAPQGYAPQQGYPQQPSASPQQPAHPNENGFAWPSNDTQPGQAPSGETWQQRTWGLDGDASGR